jgi:hypothetical protein
MARLISSVLLMAASIMVGCGALLPAPAFAVYLSSDAVGQALIYPYYTTQTSNGDSYNTYITVVNQAADVKALRVRFREGRAGREVASFNLFLSPGDTWAGAVFASPSTGAARLITTDRSCASPIFTAPSGEPPGITFTNAQYSGALADNWGTGLDRTREGWVEMIEMGTLNGDLAAAVTHDTSGTPSNCSAVQATASIVAGAPSGGISGTLTLISVANGLNFTVNAEALADLSSRSFYRPASDAYPDFNAAEIDPVSVVVANGSVYRSNWSRGADAVTAVVMRSSWSGELIMDTPTSSNTDFVMTYPTRQHYFSGGNVAPFASSCAFSDQVLSGEPVQIRYVDREEHAGTWDGAHLQCWASEVINFTNTAASQTPTPTRVLGSRNSALKEGNSINVAASMQNGWATVAMIDRSPPMTSLATSTRISLSTGAITAGAHAYYGLPIVGFSARTFSNGAIPCSGGTCQGNYGGAYPLRFTRKVVGP